MPFIEVSSPMTLFHEIATAVLLIILTLWLQCGGLVALIFWVRRVVARSPLTRALSLCRTGRATHSLGNRLHGVLILFWAGCYRWLCLRSWESAVYFSASSYVTVGYGDVVLPSNWRMLGPLESIMGVLMCGVSVSVLLATVTRLVGREARSSH